MPRIPVAYVYQSLSVPASVAASRALAELTRQMSAKHLIGCFYGGFHRDYHTHFKNLVPAIKRPKAKHLWRTCQPGDWVVMFSIPSMGWLSSFDCCQFLRMFLKLGVGIVSIKEGMVIPPGSPEAMAFDWAYLLMRRTWKMVKRRRRLSNSSYDRVKITGEWDGSDLGAFELVERLRAAGKKRQSIAAFLCDMGYRGDAFNPTHLRVARLLRDRVAPKELRIRSLTIDGLQQAELELFEAGANAAGLPLDLWAIDVLSRAAAKKMASRERESAPKRGKDRRSGQDFRNGSSPPC